MKRMKTLYKADSQEPPVEAYDLRDAIKGNVSHMFIRNQILSGAHVGHCAMHGAEGVDLYRYTWEGLDIYGYLKVTHCHTRGGKHG